MIDLPRNITAEERQYLEAVMAISGPSPKLESIWALMDLAWVESSCTGNETDSNKLYDFYNHPVWLLNGLFIEQHAESLQHRKRFAEEILRCEPDSVCDYGGGYGGLARMIAQSSSRVSVELYDPFPHPSSLQLSASCSNLKHVSQLSGPYDLMVATDVFEHVHDPLLEVEKSARHLKVGGKYLIANCFYPVIKCHLPCTFHFRDTFSSILAEMNLKPLRPVVYGTLFEKTGEILVTSGARKLEKKSRIRFVFNQGLATFRELRRLWCSGQAQ